MKVRELIEELSKLDQDKEIRFVEQNEGYELRIDAVEAGDQGDWYVVV